MCLCARPNFTERDNRFGPAPPCWTPVSRNIHDNNRNEREGSYLCIIGHNDGTENCDGDNPVKGVEWTNRLIGFFGCCFK